MKEEIFNFFITITVTVSERALSDRLPLTTPAIIAYVVHIAMQQKGSHLVKSSQLLPLSQAKWANVHKCIKFFPTLYDAAFFFFFFAMLCELAAHKQS